MTREEFESILEEAFMAGYEDACTDIYQEKMDEWHKNKTKDDIDYMVNEYKKRNLPINNYKKKSIIAGKAFHQYWTDYKNSKDPNKRKMAERMFNASKRYDKNNDYELYGGIKK